MDIICMGEMLIDFTPGKEERSYVCNPGGAPANACIAIARNGLETGFLGRLGNDDFGKLLKKTLEEFQKKAKEKKKELDREIKKKAGEMIEARRKRRAGITFRLVLLALIIPKTVIFYNNFE